MMDPRFYEALHHPERLEEQANPECRRCGGIGYLLIRKPDNCELWTVLADPVHGAHRYKVGERVPCFCTSQTEREDREIKELYRLYPEYGREQKIGQMQENYEREMENQCGVNDPDESEAIE